MIDSKKRRSRDWLVVGPVAVTLLLSVLAGCTNGRTVSGDIERSPALSKSASHPSMSASPSPQDQQDVASQAALDAYNAMWRDIVAVAQTSDYTNPRLAAHMIGSPLEHWTAVIASNQSKGWVTRGSQFWSPRVVSVTPVANPTRVVVADCLKGAEWVNYVKSSGKRAHDTRDGQHTSAAAITLQANGTWKVSEQSIGKFGSC